MDKEKEKILNEYYCNDGKKINKVVDKIIHKFGGIYQKDLDDFYSITNIEFMKILNKYDGKRNFEGLLYSCLLNKIKSEITRKNRIKRTADREAVSIDTMLGESDNFKIEDTLKSNFNLEDEVSDKIGLLTDEKVEKYLSGLPKKAREILEMKMNNVPVAEIKEVLNLTNKQYENYMNIAKYNENIFLFTKNKLKKYKENDNMQNFSTMPLDTTDDYRMDKIPLGTLLEDKESGDINCKYILQRTAFQWSELQINKFLTRVLNNQPIPEIVICEQKISGRKVRWLIDGLQRLSYAEMYINDKIVVKKDGAEFYNIKYIEKKLDENGNVVYDESGLPVTEVKEVNVIGKKFSELPEYLQRRFLKFNVTVTSFFNCSDDLIAYHIRNYNNHEGMTKNQYEITNIDILMAKRIKNISKMHPFFKDDFGKYTTKNKTKGMVERVVVESLMTINFLNDWKMNINEAFTFINDHATEEMFNNFEELLNRLCKIVNDDVKNMFNTTNSPIWFAAFSRFVKFGISDDKFIEFLKEFKNSLHKKSINGKSYDSVASRNTKNKKVVIGKINKIEELMLDYFNINKEDITTNEEINIVDFIKENTGIDVTDDDIEVYEEVLDELTLNVDNSSQLMDKANRPSFIALVAYSFNEDIDLDEWIIEFFKRNNTYISNQAENYSHMKKDVGRYFNIKEKGLA